MSKGHECVDDGERAGIYIVEQFFCALEEYFGFLVYCLIGLFVFGDKRFEPFLAHCVTADIHNTYLTWFVFVLSCSIGR